jgi:two-component system LytT family sensor kinase
MQVAPRPSIHLWPLLIWAAIAAAFTISVAGSNAIKAHPEPIWLTFWYSGAEWFVYGALAPFVMAFARRLSFARIALPRTIALLAAGWLAFHVSTWLIFGTIEWIFHIGAPDREWPTYSRLLILYFTKRAAFTLLVYAGIVVVAHLGALRRLAQERETRAAQLEAALATARLEVLKGQLQPHFLFNALNTVSSLIHAEPEKAEAVLARIGDLLRMTLQEANNAAIPLHREVAFLERYLDIQQMRFADRLRIVIDVPDDVSDALVPTLLLQPLAENAIRHGIEPRPAGGTLRLLAGRSGNELCLELHDDGVGISADGRNGHGTAGHGVGLANTRQRLEELYGAQHHFSVKPDPAGGTVVTIRIPWQVEGADLG